MKTIILLVTLLGGAWSVPSQGDLEPHSIKDKGEMTSYLGSKGLRSSVNDVCANSAGVLSEVQGYQEIVNQIIQAAQGPFAGQTYTDLANFVDKFGNRLSGTKNLENSINYVEDFLKKTGATNVRSEKVGVPKWERKFEKLELLLPRKQEMHIYGLGQSSPTPFLGIIEDCVVYNSYAEVVANPKAVRGKIAILNYGGPPSNPLDTIDNGYPILAANGAKAALYRSAATYSLYSPHARRANLYYTYEKGVPDIPIAYLTVEDADFFTRVAARGERIRVHLTMHSSDANSTSRNVFGDIRGRQLPNEYIIFAGHTDSWDVGQGAQDDAVGVFLPLKGFQLLKSLNLVPRRTITAAFWTAEEYGYYGSANYIARHSSNFGNLSVALEADYSCLASTGLVWNGVPELGCILNEIINLVGTASAGLVVQAALVRSDMDIFSEIGIPVVTLLGDDGRYFWYHHTQADTMTAVNSAELDRCLALWTSTAYILADLQNKISRV